MILYAARHAECLKNLIGIPGGPGSALTSTGILQAKNLAHRIAQKGCAPARIVACPSLQTRQTADIVAHQLALPVDVNEDLASINLGVLNGVPVHLARELHPSSSHSMDKWRSGDVELCDVVIDGMESPSDFFSRGAKYILEECARGDSIVIIATTSIMILFENMYNMRGIGRGEGYRAREYENAQLLELDFTRAHMEWIRARWSELNGGEF